jgi:hypothetical protein
MLMSEPRKVLFLTQISPFPITGGEQLRSYGLIRILSDSGIQTTAIIDARSKNVPQLPNIRFELFDFRKLPSRIHLVNIISIFRRNPSLVALIEKCLNTEKYDLAFIDYYFYGQYISMLKKKNLRVIYGTHNAQASLLLQRRATGIKSLLYKWIEYLIQSLHERIYFPRADALIIVSEKDRSFYHRFIKPERIVLIPNMIEKSSLDLDNIRKEDYIIMTANYHAFQNAIGLEWFIKNVWNDELSRLTTLKLFGYGSLKIFETLRHKYPCKNIEAMGEVEDIKPCIAKARVSIVPLLDGGGTRLKCIEAMSLKTQLVSTSKGSEGIEHHNAILIADSAVEFRQRILDVLAGRINTVSEAYRIFDEKYDLESNQLILSDLINRYIP